LDGPWKQTKEMNAWEHLEGKNHMAKCTSQAPAPERI